MTWRYIGWECVGHIPLLVDCVAENVINLINESLQYSTVKYTQVDSHDSKVWSGTFCISLTPGLFLSMFLICLLTVSLALGSQECPPAIFSFSTILLVKHKIANIFRLQFDVSVSQGP